MISDTSLRVRRCGVLDATSLRDIRLEALRDTPEAYGSKYDDVKKWSREQWMHAAAEFNYFLAERDGEVVGMVAGGHNELHPGTQWMYGMYVSASARGTGLAALLVDAVSEWARNEGGGALYLHVTTSVARARAFYQKVGFLLTGDVITMDRDPLIELVTMVKYLVE